MAAPPTLATRPRFRGVGVRAGQPELLRCDIEDNTAEVGYRVAERVAGRGFATAGVRELCRLAASEHGVRKLRARTTHENVASQRVLAKAGFVADGEAHVAGRSGIWFERDLTQP